MSYPPAHLGIEYVSRETGLSQHTIRAWEKRYGAVIPLRSDTNRRLYSTDDLERLALLRDLSNLGHRIGTLAPLPLDELRRLAPNPAVERLAAEPMAAHCFEPPGPGDLVPRVVAAVERLDGLLLERLLTHAAATVGPMGFLEAVAAPAMAEVGRRWEAGDLRIAHEHLLSAALRSVMGQTLDSLQPSTEAPVALVGAPAGQLHELGALSAGITAVLFGWRVLYLGPNLPVPEIVGAAQTSGARVVALSVTHAFEGDRFFRELPALCRQLGPAVRVVVGGQTMGAHREAAQKAGAFVVPTLLEFRQELAKFPR